MTHPFEASMPSPRMCRSIGEIIALQNALELSLSHLLWQTLKLPLGVFGTLYDALNNRARSDLLLRLAYNIHGEAEVEAIAYALRLFDLCTENRNIVAHSVYDGRLGRRYVFWKNATTAGTFGWYFAVLPSELAMTADEMRRTHRYLGDLYFEFHRRGLNEPLPLPDRPPQPRKLSLFRLPEGHPYEQPQPQSYGG